MGGGIGEGEKAVEVPRDSNLSPHFPLCTRRETKMCGADGSSVACAS